MSVSTILSIIGFPLSLILYVISLILIFRIFYIIHKTSRAVSSLLLINLIAWTIVCISALPYVTYMIIVWRLEDSTTDARWMFWTGAPSQFFFAAIPISVFMLTLDRIYCVSWPAKYQHRPKALITIICAVLMFLSVMVYMWGDFNELPISDETACQAFGCLLTHQTELITFRLVFAILNTAAELTFLYKLFIFRKNSVIGKGLCSKRATSFANKANQIVLIIVISDFVLNFIPQLVTLIIVQFPFRKILARIGPYNSVSSGFDVLITAITYTRVLRKSASKESSSTVVYTKRVNYVKT